MKTSRLLVIILCCSIMITLIGCSTQANVETKRKVAVSASYPHYSTIESLAERADLVIKGTIVDLRVEEMDTRINPKDKDPSRKDIYTVYTVKVTDSYKGNVKPGETVEVKQIGGENEKKVYVATDKVEFIKNKQYTMFLSTYENFPASLLNPIQAAYTYEEEAGITQSTENKGRLFSTNAKNDITLTIEDLERIKNKYKTMK